MAIGLPQIDITFQKLAGSIIQRSERGIAALIVSDNTQSAAVATVNEYRSVLAVEANKFTPANVAYIKTVLSSGASKVIVASVPTESVSTVADAIEIIGSRKYNWIGLAEGTTEEQSDLAAYISEQEDAKRSVKAVVFDVVADRQHVVNFTNANVTYKDGTTVTGEKYVPRLIGLLAGLPLTQSATYFVLDDLASVEEPVDLDAAIDDGEFILFNDEETVRVARGVNSLTTTSATVSEDFKKILIVETLDQIREDISNVFKNEYLGKFKNKYDNQVIFISAVNGYFAGLAADGILDNEFANAADVDVEAQRAAWLASGKSEAEEWDDQTVKNNPFRSNVYLAGNISVPDAMEDLSFGVELQ